MSKNKRTNETGKRLETSFRELKPLYSKAEAAMEAHRCLYCFDAPCIKACPAEIDIPAFIKKIATGNIRGSAKKILEPNLLGLSTGHVCPVEELCAGACVYNDYNDRPINIGRLQRYSVVKAVELENHNGRIMFKPKPLGNRKAALIGGGPASLACAAYLRLAGVKVTIYEKNSQAGGLNITGIAPYKMQVTDAMREIEWLLNLGLDIKTGIEIEAGHISKLSKENDAVFIGVGLGNDNIVNIPGENNPGVWGAVDLISKIKTEADFKLPEFLKKVIVIGGGNTAIDIARELAVLGVNKVDILYRRTKHEMRAYVHEFEGAKKYGVRLIENQKPLEISP
ncbi:MAG: FAD-dependent oxidoreductase, partial [Candidatus Neomarinimicrobiota bacterium]